MLNGTYGIAYYFFVIGCVNNSSNGCLHGFAKTFIEVPHVGATHTVQQNPIIELASLTAYLQVIA